MPKLNLGTKKCLNCGKIIKLKIRRDIKRKKFCSRSCRTKWGLRNGKCGMLGKKHTEHSKELIGMYDKNGKNNGNWKGGIQNGVYIKHWISPNKYAFIHREAIEAFIGRKLTKQDIVHHIDGNKHNNDINNLVLCNGRSEHRTIHHQLEAIAYKLVQLGLIKFDHNNKQYYVSSTFREET